MLTSEKLKKCNVCFPNYDRSIVNLSATIMSHYGIDTAKMCLPELSSIISKNHKMIILLVCDGMGSFNIDRTVGENSFLAKHKISNITSVFPPTTVAALTSIESGLEPCEHGLIGWTLYLDKVCKKVQTFGCIDVESGKTITDPAIRSELEYNTIFDMLKGKNVKNHILSPFSPRLLDKCHELADYEKRIARLSKKRRARFVYAYYNRPDHDMHDNGAFSNQAKQSIQEISEMLERLKGKLHDTLIIITADHGQIDREEILLPDDLLNCLECPPTVEPTAMSFKVKKGMDATFVEIFNSKIESYILLTSDEAEKSGLFGDRISSNNFKSRLCDYFAIATGDKFYSEKPSNFIGTHAGLTKEEMTVPLIVIDC